MPCVYDPTLAFCNNYSVCRYCYNITLSRYRCDNDILFPADIGSTISGLALRFLQDKAARRKPLCNLKSLSVFAVRVKLKVVQSRNCPKEVHAISEHNGCFSQM